MKSSEDASACILLVVRFQHSHPIAASTFANVGIKGPLEIIDSSGALDLTFALRVCGQQGSERQIRSTSALQRQSPLIRKRKPHGDLNRAVSSNPQATWIG
jgi:hypothetical protein